MMELGWKMIAQLMEIGKQGAQNRNMQHQVSPRLTNTGASVGDTKRVGDSANRRSARLGFHAEQAGVDDRHDRGRCDDSSFEVENKPRILAHVWRRENGVKRNYGWGNGGLAGRTVGDESNSHGVAVQQATCVTKIWLGVEPMALDFGWESGGIAAANRK